MHTDAYLENDVLHKDPVELICLLYGKALEKLKQAREHLEAGRIRERSAAMARAMEIVAELQGALNRDDGGEVAENLNRLYTYILEKLNEGNTQQQTAPLDEAAALLEVLYDGWRECRENLAAGPNDASESLVPSHLEEAAREWIS